MQGDIEELRKRSALADEMIASLRLQIAEVRRVALRKMFADEIANLRRDNQLLEVEVSHLKTKLVTVEVKNGVKQIEIPNGDLPSTKTEKLVEQIKPVEQPPAKIVKETITKPEQKTPKQEKTDKKQSKTVPNKESEAEPDVSQLDFRVGLIATAKKHPDADSLYVEEVDVGEERPRTVVSGLVKFVPIEKMQNRLAVLLCNLKPAKMRGVTSEAMVMCASTPEKVEILDPPAGSVPGDRVICEDFPGEPEKQLNPKKKVFEQVAPYLKTNENGVATYKGKALMVKGKGVVVSATLKGVQIK
ncbi:Aminoacyl tRNA synthase complex-interacting multifunctional protein 1 [Chamberlinius hualienensis]